MPDVSYTIYRTSTIGDLGSNHEADTLVLIRVDRVDATNPQAAVRHVYRLRPEKRDALTQGPLVVIPSRNHHDVNLTVEDQPRLVFE